MLSRTEIENRALTLIEKAGVEEELPVPLEKIAAFLGFQTFGFVPEANDPDTANVSGMIDYANRQIFVNTAESLPRQRFTLAHELGHASLHGADNAPIIDFRSELDQPNSDKEREANQFAAALLMPRTDFIRQWVKWKGDVEMLGRIFGASKQAVEIRCKATVNASL
jgi:Zn-dependent peptidase ImmA (M78 family)